MQLIDGKATAAAIKEQIAQEVAQIVAAGGKQPHLVAVLVGHDGGSETYVKNKVLACEKCSERRIVNLCKLYIKSYGAIESSWRFIDGNAPPSLNSVGKNSPATEPISIHRVNTGCCKTGSGGCADRIHIHGAKHAYFIPGSTGNSCPGKIN